MCQAFKNNMESLGIQMTWAEPGKLYGSSDIGNVSIKIPAIHDYLSITDDKTIQSHSKEYTKAAATPQADEICLKGAKGLAMTALDSVLRSTLTTMLRFRRNIVKPVFFKAYTRI